MSWTRSALLEHQRALLAGLYDAESNTVLPAAHDRLVEDLVSPYSAKLRAYYNFRGLPYQRVRIDMRLYMETMNRLVGFPIMPVVVTAGGRVMQDTTPIMEHLEAQADGAVHPSAQPEDPAMAFVAWLLEDFADEYLPRLIMHTRWGTAQNREALAHRIARRLSWSQPAMDHGQIAQMILARQSGFDHHLAISDATRPDLDAQILELLALLEAHLGEHRFLLGDRPSVADFAFYGPIWAHMWMDPASAGILEVHGRRTCDWLDTMTEFGDTRGLADTRALLGDWLELGSPTESLPESLTALLRFAARTHLPNARATAKASVARDKRYRVEIRGLECEFSTHHYRAWSFEQVQRRYLGLDAAPRRALEPALTQAGILPGLVADGLQPNGLYDGLTPPFVVDGIGDARIARRRARDSKTARS